MIPTTNAINTDAESIEASHKKMVLAVNKKIVPGMKKKTTGMPVVIINPKTLNANL
jgi:hypothetical protein